MGDAPVPASQPGVIWEMTAAGPLLLAVISTLLWLTRGFDPAPSACSALASGVLYGSFSLKDLFPTIASGCSWTLENPDPTKYSLYLRFNREEQAASPSPATQRPEEEEEEQEQEEAELELCEGAGPFTFLHFDKNFVQLCLAAEPEAAPRLLAPQALEFRFVEVLLINNNNSSQFTCSVLCRWLEECLQAPGARRCGFTHAGCSCQAEPPAAPRHNGTRHGPRAPAAPPATACCPTDLRSGDAGGLDVPDVPHGERGGGGGGFRGVPWMGPTWERSLGKEGAKRVLCMEQGSCAMDRPFLCMFLGAVGCRSGGVHGAGRQCNG
uniref:Adhesion G protein-coupled receptor B N-terminal domain-containing protein n=1 Tax=Amazona collaria TaxID=241587 RepID=A0A8B9F4F1_9PSIT